MKPQLRRLIEDVSWKCDILFEAEGVIRPTWYFAQAGMAPQIMGSPGHDKSSDVALMRVLFEMTGVQRYCFVDEGWTIATNKATGAEFERVRQIALAGKVHEQPDRIEVVMFVAEDFESTLMATRLILREPGKPARLGRLKISENVGQEGRFVGLLRRSRC